MLTAEPREVCPYSIWNGALSVLPAPYSALGYLEGIR